MNIFVYTSIVLSILLLFTLGGTRTYVADVQNYPEVFPDEFTLDVPFYTQEYDKSCESAALRMVLEFYGIKKNDWDILVAVGYTPRAIDYINNIWDDPSEMFVGYVEKGKSGYGVYAEPIAKAANSFGRDAQVYKNISAPFIAEQIMNGHPVIVWGYTIGSTLVPYVWKTNEGKEIRAYRGEHVRVVVGFKGSSANPEGFYVHDPNVVIGDANQYWSTKQLMDNMNSMGELTNQSVVVR